LALSVIRGENAKSFKNLKKIIHNAKTVETRATRDTNCTEEPEFLKGVQNGANFGAETVKRRADSKPLMDANLGNQGENASTC
jgi:hypothetical protein